MFVLLVASELFFFFQFERAAKFLYTRRNMAKMNPYNKSKHDLVNIT